MPLWQSHDILNVKKTICLIISSNNYMVYNLLNIFFIGKHNQTCKYAQMVALPSWIAGRLRHLMMHPKNIPLTKVTNIMHALWFWGGISFINHAVIILLPTTICTYFPHRPSQLSCFSHTRNLLYAFQLFLITVLRLALYFLCLLSQIWKYIIPTNRLSQLFKKCGAMRRLHHWSKHLTFHRRCWESNSRKSQKLTRQITKIPVTLFNYCYQH